MSDLINVEPWASMLAEARRNRRPDGEWEADRKARSKALQERYAAETAKAAALPALDRSAVLEPIEWAEGAPGRVEAEDATTPHSSEGAL